MLRCRNFLISMICLFIFGITISSNAEEEIEDLIILQNRKVKLSRLSREKRQLPLIFDQMRRCCGVAQKVI